ncbi:MAG: HAD-IIA family hydrolase [Clostridiales bacterium]|nr:HAD-IIA family hydrolase [Clostridiales bacterium]
MNNILYDKQVFILDMDGTFYMETTPIDGALEFLNILHATGRKYIFFTNNSSKSIKDYIKKLKKMGVDATEDNLFSSGAVTIDYLKRKRPGKSVYLIGTESLTESFLSAGIELDSENPDIVVLGFDTTLTYEKIYKGCTFLREGAEFIATHPDINCPVKGGLMPDTGSMIKMFTESTGVKPEIMGKPNSHTVEALEATTGVSREKMVFVGDRLQTDIAIGINNGATAILVMTGATTEEILAQSDIKPTLVLPSIAHIKEYL